MMNDTAPTLSIYVLGRFEVQQGQRIIENEQWRSGKARSLFKIMLARRGYQLSRHEATELLWPELDQDKAYNNLNQAVYSLRRILEPGLTRAGGSAYLKTEGNKLYLNSSLIGWMDLEEFQRLRQQAQLSHDLRLYEQAAALYRGDYLLEDLYEDWSVARRENLRHEWTNFMMQMAQLYQARNQSQKYILCLHRILENDFLNEWAVQQLMSVTAETGRREEALAYYRHFAAKLRNRLNMEPLPETVQLYQDIAGGGLNGYAANLPILPPEVVTATPVAPMRRGQTASLSLPGREQELAHWQQLLLGGRGGLTLLSGEAGIGKSHLARAMAEQARQHDYKVLTATCYPEAEGSLSPFPELLEEALSGLSEAELEDCLRCCNPEIYRLLPGLSHRWQNRPVHNLPEPNLNATFSTILQALNWLGRQQKLVLVLDDWQHLAGTALRLLHYLLTHPSLARLLVIGTLQTTSAVAPLPELNQVLNWASETGQSVLRLNRLPKQPLARMLAAVLNAPLDEITLAKLNDRSQGNPRIALELAQGWNETGTIRLLDGMWQSGPTDGPLPARLTNYIKRLVASFSSEAQTLLNLAALAGPDFSFELLRLIVGQRSDGAGWWIELDKTRLGTVLLEVTRAGLVAETQQGYRFAFPMLAAALVEGMPHSQKVCWLEVIDWARMQVQA